MPASTVRRQSWICLLAIIACCAATLPFARDAAAAESALSPSAAPSPMSNPALAAASGLRPGDVINSANANKVKALVSPGNYILVKQGMEMDIVPTQALQWPPPYKSATEKYSPQVSLTSGGSLTNYTAGLPFPLLDPNDPQVALKIMWNFSFRPQYNDDVDARYTQVGTYTASSHGSPAAHFAIGHFGFYNNVGRIEVEPFPTDPDFKASGIRYRFAVYPFLEPSSMLGFGLVRYRYMDPKMEDNVWFYLPSRRKLRRMAAYSLSDVLGDVGGASPYFSTIDPDSYFGFAAKIEDFNYKLLGEKQMLACVHAKNSPEHNCPNDGGRTVCPENWELRHLYIVQADAKNGLNTIPHRIFYIDSEGWFITAADQYDRDGKLWKTIATFNTYRDRPVPGARVAIFPYKRMFQLALVDEDVQTGNSSIIFMPEANSPVPECWYIDEGTVTNAFFMAQAMGRAIMH